MGSHKEALTSHFGSGTPVIMGQRGILILVKSGVWALSANRVGCERDPNTACTSALREDRVRELGKSGVCALGVKTGCA